MITFLDDRDKAEIEETMTNYVQSVVGTLELNWTDGGYISKDDGAVYEEIGSSYSNFVPVEPGDRLIISNTMTSDTEWNAFYDANETFKSSFSNASGTIVVPNGVYKMRLSKYTSASIVIVSEVSERIQRNKSLIDAITTSKINVSDIIDNLTTNVSNKPLSAAQGVALKALIDDIPKTSTGMERIEKLSTDTAVELEPNKLYIFPEMAELAITLAEPSDTGIANEYHVVFQSGSTPTAFMIPSAINLPSEFAVEANNVYRISILEGCLTAYSWYTIPFVFHVKIDSSLDYPYLFCWESYKNVGNTIWGDVWPGEPMVENENGWFTRELPPQQHSGNLHCIVTNEAGNKQTTDIDIDDSKSDVWITVNASYEYMVYYEKPTI